MIRNILRCAWNAVSDTIQHDGIEHAGYLAFLGLLALFPFLVFVVSVLGTIDPNTVTAQELANLFHRMPLEITQALEPRIHEITSGPPQGLLTLAIIGALWTASSAVEGLRTILNRAYRVHTPPRYIFRRSLSILQMLIFAFVLIVGMVLIVTLPALISGIDGAFGLEHRLPADTGYWSRIVYGISLSLLLLVVAWVYYAVPNIRQRWVSVWPGAIAVVLLWVLTARLFALYLGNFHQITLIYGSLGGIIAALLFFYACNVIFIFGAEFNHHISHWAGVQVEEREKPKQ